jgi:Asp-tRNA(Asn)/Glu-tRNA(Gln) amidotransferase A subunit family amidase
MARTIQDLRLLFEAVCGYDPGDPASSPVPVRPGSNRANKKLRIGFYKDDEYSSPTPETRDAVLAAAEHLSRCGFEVEPFRPDMLNRARELWSILFVEAIAMVLRPMVSGREDEISENSREFLALADEQPALTGERLLNTLIERDSLRSRLLAQMEDFPVLLAPVCSVPAFRHEDGGWGAKYAADYMRTMSYSQHYNLLGNPAAVVPIRQSTEGLPIGVQIIGRPFEEHEVLSVADILDQQFGWKSPPLQSQCLANEKSQ